jgi:hypothetical protein
MLNAVMLKVLMLNVIMLNVISLSVMAPVSVKPTTNLFTVVTYDCEISNGTITVKAVVFTSMENVQQVVVPIVVKCFCEKYFIFMYLFYPTSPLI